MFCEQYIEELETSFDTIVKKKLYFLKNSDIVIARLLNGNLHERNILLFSKYQHLMLSYFDKFSLSEVLKEEYMHFTTSNLDQNIAPSVWWSTVGFGYFSRLGELAARITQASVTDSFTERVWTREGLQ
ncbi:hypothetical protein P9112_010460 [Eukaryota sp. TZLM1-RC]